MTLEDFNKRMLDFPEWEIRQGPTGEAFWLSVNHTGADLSRIGYGIQYDNQADFEKNLSSFLDHVYEKIFTKNHDLLK